MFDWVLNTPLNYKDSKLSKGSKIDRDADITQRKIFTLDSFNYIKDSHTRFFYKQRFFSTQRQVLLNTNKHHHTETLFIFTIFVPMPRPRSIYAISM